MIDYTLDAACTNVSFANCEVWAHQNRLGSVVATTDSTGAVIEKYTYSSYGVSDDASGFPFRFTGQKLDPETGLYYYKARYYDPEVGRFLQTDPIGYEDQMNLYAYVLNDPINKFDPTGGNSEEGHQRMADATREAGSEAIKATEIFVEEKQALDDVVAERGDDPTAAGADKQHHCTANCEATKLGETGEATAELLSNAKEAYDRVSGRNTQEESDADQRANEAGREAGRRGDACYATCGEYVQENENSDYEPTSREDDS